MFSNGRLLVGNHDDGDNDNADPNANSSVAEENESNNSRIHSEVDRYELGIFFYFSCIIIWNLRYYRQVYSMFLSRNKILSMAITMPISRHNHAVIMQNFTINDK